MEIRMIRGLPASGKTTYANTLVEKGWVRVNKDDLRAMLHRGKWSKENEKQILQTRDMIIINAVKAGKNVVVDDTNLSLKHVDTIRNLAITLGTQFSIHTMETDVETCLKRDIGRPNAVGRDVILRMYHDFYTETTPRRDEKLLNCIICDLDGTLALFSGNPYNRDFEADVPNYHVINILTHWKAVGGQVIILSGRNRKHEPATVSWLNTHEVPFDTLIMRPEDDNQSDITLKREMYYEYIEPFYNVEFVIDDRPKVVREWRRLGFFVFDVNQKGYEF